MNKTIYKHTICWLAVAFWMVLIFRLSAQTATESGGMSEILVRWFAGVIFRGFDAMPLQRQAEILEILQLIVRKGAHFTEYAILAMLIANAIRCYSPSKRMQWWLPVVASAFYAVTDEIHQYFVPGRACRALDMGIDTCGAMFGTAIFVLGMQLVAKKHRP